MGIAVAIVVGSILLGSLLVIDVFLSIDKVDGNTWSEILRTWGKQTPFVAWACGVLLGHWFHPGNKAMFGQPNSAALLIWLTLLLTMVGFAASKFGHPIPSWSILLPAVLAGMLLWPVS